MKDLNQSYAAFDQASTIVCVVELSQNSWLLACTAPGLKRQPCKKLSSNPHELLKQIRRWRTEAEKAGYEIKRIVAAFEAGRDGFWLARWLGSRDIEVYAIHPTGLAGDEDETMRIVDLHHPAISCRLPDGGVRSPGKF